MKQPKLLFSLVAFLAISTQTIAIAVSNDLKLSQANPSPQPPSTTNSTPTNPPQTSWRNPRLIFTLNALTEAEVKQRRGAIGISSSRYPVSISVSNTLATGGDNAVRLWNLETGKEIATPLQGEGVLPFGIQSLAFSSDGKLLSVASEGQMTIQRSGGSSSTSVSYDGGIAEVWNVGTRTRLGYSPGGVRLLGNQAAIAGSLGSSWSLIYYNNGQLKVPIIRNNQEQLLSFPAFGFANQFFSLIPNSQILAVFGLRGVEFRDLENVNLLGSFDGKSLISSSNSKPLTPNNLSLLASERCVAASPSGDLLALSSDKSVTIINIQDLQNKIEKNLPTEIKQFDSRHQDNITFMAFSHSASNPVLATASKDKTVKLWDAKTGALLKTITDHTDEVTSVVFSPDGKTLVTSGMDGKVRIWRDE